MAKADKHDKKKPGTRRGAVAAPAAPALPDSRDALLALHRAARHRRDAAPLLSEERAEASEELARIEVHIARIERAMDPPLV